MSFKLFSFLYNKIMKPFSQKVKFTCFKGDNVRQNPLNNAKDFDLLEKLIFTFLKKT